MWIQLFEWMGPATAMRRRPPSSRCEDQPPAPGAATAHPAHLQHPNGIQLAALRRCAQRPQVPPPVLCLIGRVVPIRTSRPSSAPCAAWSTSAQAEGWIARPRTKTLLRQECQNLVRSLGLETHPFLGFQRWKT